jgi:hypothetical protein
MAQERRMYREVKQYIDDDGRLLTALAAADGATEYRGQGSTQARFPEGVLTIQFGFKIDAKDIDAAFLAYAAAANAEAEKQREEAERQHTRAMLLSGPPPPRVSSAPGNNGKNRLSRL